MKNISRILNDFSPRLNLSDNFDHKTLDTKGLTQKEAVIIPKEEYLKVIDKIIYATFNGYFGDGVNQV